MYVYYSLTNLIYYYASGTKMPEVYCLYEGSYKKEVTKEYQVYYNIWE